ncbi:MAG TPA: 30S ribosomal protein S12 methylthiotransferase RimO, partial [Candidatus Omnitrophota bacterium]|nr:30S ribosomal protein S12 methylthiotransferase RimO [Candidatus Omnitrophota bacterium]
LKLMNRKVTKREILAVVSRIRRRVPRAALRTTFIVGFPTETRDEFVELCGFVKKSKFDKAGAFKYSQEEGTKAALLKGQIEDSEKERRYDILMSLQKNISESLLRKRRGKTVSVMVDEKKKDGVYICRTMWDAPDVDGVFFLNSKRALKTGDIVKARVTDTLEYDLSGELE